MSRGTSFRTSPLSSKNASSRWNPFRSHAARSSSPTVAAELGYHELDQIELDKLPSGSRSRNSRRGKPRGGNPALESINRSSPREAMFDAVDSRRLENGSRDSRASSLDNTDEETDADDEDEQRKPLHATGLSEDSDDDSDDLQKPSRAKAKRSSRYWTWANNSNPVLFALVGTMLLFCAATWLIARTVTNSHLAGDDVVYRPKLLSNLKSNGTMLFAPTTILISIDGFRADFITRGQTPTLAKLVSDPETVHPEYMLPSFPSLTFPNHHTIITGLYPESHGMVANRFWDSSLNERFSSREESSIRQARWWGGEPLWRTAAKQDVRSAMVMWPGSVVRTMAAGQKVPLFSDTYRSRQPLNEKVDRAFEFLDMPGPEPIETAPASPDGSTREDGLDEYSFPSPEAYSKPQLIGLYVPDVDSAGHTFGPNSTAMNSVLESADVVVSYLLSGLKARNLTSIVNLVILSDHGMATTSAANGNNQTVRLDHLLDPSTDLAHPHPDTWPLAGLWPSTRISAPDLAAKVRSGLQRVLPEHQQDAIRVYLRDEDMPEELHYSKNKDRIAPVLVLPQPGWTLVHPGDPEGAFAGLHGYDHRDPLMRAIFVASGPAFNRTRIVTSALEERNGLGGLSALDGGPIRGSNQTGSGDGEDRDDGGSGSKIADMWAVVEDKWKSLISSLFPSSGSDESESQDSGSGGGGGRGGGGGGGGGDGGDGIIDIGGLSILERARPFQNVNVYNLLCESLGIEPAPNNGTLTIRDLVIAGTEPAAGGGGGDSGVETVRRGND